MEIQNWWVDSNALYSLKQNCANHASDEVVRVYKSADLDALLEREMEAYLEGVEWGIKHMSKPEDWPLSWEAKFPGLKAQALIDRAARAAVTARRGGEQVNNLLERQAEFVYDGARLAAIAAKAPVVPVQWIEREEPFRAQFLKVIERQVGPNRSSSPEELHGSWMQSYFEMGWVYGEKYDRSNKTHPDLVPYAQLGPLERDKDAVFVLLCEIARQYIYDQPPR